MFQDGSFTTISSASRFCSSPKRQSRIAPRSHPRESWGAITPPKGGYLPPKRITQTQSTRTRKGAQTAFREMQKMPQLDTGLQTVPFQRFQVLFNSLFKVLFIFPSRYLFAIGLSPVFSFRRNLPPALSCSPKQLDSLKACRAHANTQRRTGLSPSIAPFSKGLAPGPRAGNCFYRLQFGAHETRRFSV